MAKENKISIHFYSYYGKYLGSFFNERINKNGKVLIKQIDFFQQNKVKLSKEVINGLIINKLNYLEQYRKKGNEKSKEVYKQISALLLKLKNANSVENVMGLEGMSWNFFYSFLKELYQKENFTERNKRPPKDMINSMISFLNTLIYNRIETEFSRTDLYTEISFLHSTNQKRNSLVLDIAELYKIDITYRLIGYLVGKKMIKKTDFEMIDGMCAIKSEARKIIISEFEKTLQKTYKDEKLKRSVTMEHSIKLEAYKLIRSCLEQKEYKPIIVSGVDFGK